MKKTGLALLLALPLLCAAQLPAPRAAAPSAEAEYDSLIVVLRETASVKKDGSPALASMPGLQGLSKALRSPSSSKKGAALSPARRRMERVYRADAVDTNALPALLERLRKHPDVEFAEPNYRVYPLAMPSDLFANEVWALNNTGQVYYSQGTFYDIPPSPESGTPGADIDWLEAWEAGLPTNEVIVAVIDTGVDYNHPELVNQMWVNPGEIAGNGIDDDGNGYADDIYGMDALNEDSDPMDDHAHGTHCAGTIAAETDNLIGIAGINPNAKIMACKFLGASGGSSLDAIACIFYAADNGAQVMNNSWGGGGFSQTLQDAIDYAVNEKGAVFLAAAGNSDTEALSYPAAYDYVTAVAASTSDDEKASFSNYGFWVDVTAPGHDILSLRTTHPVATRDDDSYWITKIHPSDTNLAIFSGTSMACPAAAGAMSLLVADKPGYPAWVYGRVMEASCDTNIYNVGVNTNYIGDLGAGRIHVPSLLAYDETNAFIFATLDVEDGFAGMVVKPGDTKSIFIEAGAWTHDVENLSVELEPLAQSASNITLNATTYSIGTLAAGAVTNLPEGTFTVTVNEDVTSAGWNYIRAKLKSGSEVLDEMYVYVGTARKSITDFQLADLDLDGIDEIVSYYDDSITVYDGSGSPLWEFVGDENTWGYIQSLAVGNVDPSDDEPEIVVVREYVSPGDTYGDTNRAVQVISHEGQDEGVAPFAKGWNESNVALANMDDDPELEVVSARTHVYAWYTNAATHVSVYDITNGAAVLLWELDTGFSDTAYNMEHLSAPAVGDFDHDGKPDVACTRAKALGENSKLEICFGSGSQLSVPVPAGFELRTGYGITAGDLNFDGTMELVFTVSDPDTTYVLAYEHDGSFVDGWPQLLGQGITHERSPVLADIDSDSDLEVLIVDSYTGDLYGWAHDGSPLAHFPIADGTNLHSNIRVADMDGDGEPEMVYAGAYYNTDEDTLDYSFRLTARNFDGTFVRGFPQTITGSDGFDAVFTLDTLPWGLAVGPLLSSELQTNAVIVVAADSDPFIWDSGQRFDPNASDWAQGGADAQRTFAYSYRFDELRASVVLPNESVLTGVYAQISADIFADDPENLIAYWDVDGDDVYDLSGAGLFSVSNQYGSAGDTVITLFVTNTVTGETWTQHKTISVLEPLDADFSGTPLSIPSAPGRVQFTDESQNGPQTWLWNFGDGATSTEQNPAHVYTTNGSFEVSLTVSNNFGVHGASSDSVTKTAYVSVGAPDATVTNHYVSQSGLHIYPFTSWEKAATNVNAAVEAAAAEGEGHHVWITNGFYEVSSRILLSNSVSLHGINGAAATILDGVDARHVMMFSWNKTDNGCLVEGLTIQNGLQAFYGGGALFRNCVIRGHRERAMEMTSALTAAARMEDCVLEYNEGGALWTSGRVEVERCIFRYNTMQNTNLFLVHYTPSSASTLRDCLFHSNTNGGMLLGWQNKYLENLTIVDNDCSQEAVYLESFTYPMEARNLIVVSNRVPSGSPMIYVSDEEDDPGHSWNYARLYNSYVDGTVETNFFHALSFVDVQSNDVQFVNPALNDYRLLTNSPCIDDGHDMLTIIGGSTTQVARIDFGSSSTQVTGLWNHVTSAEDGVKLTEMTNTAGAATGFGLVFSNAFDGVYTAGVNTNGLYPADVIRDGLRTEKILTSTNSVKLRLTGLSTSNAYTLILLGSSTENDLDGLTAIYPPDVPIPDYKQTLSTYSNTTEALTVPDLVPEPDGALSVELEDYSQHIGSGVLSAMEVIEQTQIASYSATNRTDLAGRPRVTGAAIDVGAYENQGDFAPIAAFTASPDEGLPTLSVSFDASASSDPDGSIVSYDWNFGDGTTGSGISPSHDYTDFGIYAASLTVTDNDGFSNTVAKTIRVTEPIPAIPENLLAVTNASPTGADISWQDVSDSESGFVLQRTDAIEPDDIIVDNSSPYCTVKEYDAATWTLVSMPGAYGDGKCLRSEISLGIFNTSRVTYEPTFTETDVYNIYVWYPASDDHVASAYIEVNSPAGDETVYVNQQVNGGQWNFIASMILGPGSSVVIESVKSDTTRYVVADAVRFERSGAFSTIATPGSNAVSYADSGLTPDKRYFYRIAATNEYGSSVWSDMASVTLPPTNAYPVAAFTIHTNALYSGNRLYADAAASSDADGSIAYYDWDFGDNYAGSLQAGTNLSAPSYVYEYPGTYTVTLTVTDNFGDTDTATRQITVSGQPPSSAPDGLAALADGTTRIMVSWNDTSFNEDGFELQRDGVTIAGLGFGVESYSDGDVSIGEVYSYRVRATNEYGVSDWAGPVSGTLDTADVSLPFTEPFETPRINAGALNGQRAWSGDGTVQTDVARDSQALALTDGTVSHSFIGSPTNVWITLWVQGVVSHQTPNVDADAVAAFYANSNAALVVFDGTSETVTEEAFSNDWNKVELFVDYVSKHWNISLNGIEAATNLGFYADASAFSQLIFDEGSTNTAYFDDIGVSDSQDDADGDGLPDDWENEHFGSNAPAPDDPASNSTYTVRQAYIAGLDPTDPDAEFTLSNVRNILGWNAATGRVYTIWWSSNLLSGFQLLESNFTGGAFTDTTHSAHGEGFYKIDVRVE
jgi:subtilisin family serine protease/PKD repeat protein